jgi:hypothetical protein
LRRQPCSALVVVVDTTSRLILGRMVIRVLGSSNHLAISWTADERD